MTWDAIARAVRALDLGVLAGRRWYATKGEAPVSARLAHAFALAPDVALTLVDVRTVEPGDRMDRYAIPLVLRDGVVREAAEGDGAWRALVAAIVDGRSIPAMARPTAGEEPGTGGPVEAALVCRPSPGLKDVLGHSPVDLAAAVERPLGRDQSNTSVVVGEGLLVKAYRRVQPGLNPDLELTAYLSEEAAFPGVPRLAGWAEVVTRDAGAATIAMLQAFVGHAEDAYEATAERLAAMVAAPGTVSLEWATEIAEDLGILVAGLHAALATPPADAPDFAPRPATHDELKGWRREALRQLGVSVAAVAGVDAETALELRREAATIAARLSRLEATTTAPLVMRIHADLHLGQVLVADDGYRIVDFEGEPLRPVEDRRRPDSPLRDVASMLRSLDHVARSARRRAVRAHGGPIDRPALDTDAWVDRARERFLAGYASGLRQAGAPIVLDLDLLDAFEVAKELYEFEYAATVLPSWMWAPREGMHWLLGRGDPR